MRHHRFADLIELVPESPPCPPSARPSGFVACPVVLCPVWLLPACACGPNIYELAYQQALEDCAPRLCPEMSVN